MWLHTNWQFQNVTNISIMGPFHRWEMHAVTLAKQWTETYHQSTCICAVEWLDSQTQGAMSGYYCHTAKWRPVMETEQSVPKVWRHFYWWLKYRAQVADVKQGAVLVPLWLQITRSITCLNEHKSFKTDSKIWDSKLRFPFITQHSFQRTIYFSFEDIIVTTRTRLSRIKLQM